MKDVSKYTRSAMARVYPETAAGSVVTQPGAPIVDGAHRDGEDDRHLRPPGAKRPVE